MQSSTCDNKENIDTTPAALTDQLKANSFGDAPQKVHESSEKD